MADRERVIAELEKFQQETRGRRRQGGPDEEPRSLRRPRTLEDLVVQLDREAKAIEDSLSFDLQELRRLNTFLRAVDGACDLARRLQDTIASPLFLESLPAEELAEIGEDVFQAWGRVKTLCRRSGELQQLRRDLSEGVRNARLQVRRFRDRVQRLRSGEETFLAAERSPKTYTEADAKPILDQLLHLVGRHGVKEVSLVGSVAEKGSSEKDVDLLVVVDPAGLGLTKQQVDDSDNGWSQDDSFINPPPSTEAHRKLDAFRRAIETALRAAGCRYTSWERDIINTPCRVRGRDVPTDVFISPEFETPAGLLVEMIDVGKVGPFFGLVIDQFNKQGRILRPPAPGPTAKPVRATRRGVDLDNVTKTRDANVRLEEGEISVVVFDSSIADTTRAHIESQAFPATREGAAEATEFLRSFAFDVKVTL